MSAEQMTPASREDARRDAVIARWEVLAPTPEAISRLFRVFDRNGCSEAICAYPETEACECRCKFQAQEAARGR